MRTCTHAVGQTAARPERNLGPMNLPNAITIARIALVPLFVFLAYGDTDPAAIAAFSVFLVASLSDFLDGYLARRSAVITRAGEFLDPLADKLLVGAALYALVATRSFPLWAALVIGAREVIIQVLRIRIVSTGGTLPASPLAKMKTVLQICMVSWWLLPWEEISFAHWWWLTAALIATVASGARYFSNWKSTEPAIER